MKANGSWAVIRKLWQLVPAMSLVCASLAFAGPPARTMLISGEILVDGLPVAEKTELKLRVAQTDLVTESKVSAAGTSYYRLVLPLSKPARSMEGSSVKFISLGGVETQASMAALNWTEGGVLSNVLVRTALQKAPKILAASATQDSGGNWALKVVISPLEAQDSGAEALSYDVQWFVRTGTPAEPGSSEPRAKPAARETLASVSSPGESSLSYAAAIDGGDLFEVYVTPEGKEGKKGPSARQAVYPVLTQGAL